MAKNSHGSFSKFSLSKRSSFATDQVELSTPLTMASSSSSSSLQTFAAFSHIISPLLLRALADLGFARPTLVQQKAIPLALENRDVLARARTGSGKTAAYCIPLVQKILNAKAVGKFPFGSNHRSSEFDLCCMLYGCRTSGLAMRLGRLRGLWCLSLRRNFRNRFRRI